MPRQPRLLLSHSYYHIMTRGNNRKIVFENHKDYQYYLDLILRFKKELPFNLFHYCLMPNHVHFLMQTQNGSDFSVFMKKINLAYFYHYKKRYGWTGHFWQDRFKSQPVGKDEYFIQCGKYIELNPVRSKIVKNPENYLYSSYRYYVLGKLSGIINEDFFYSDLKIIQKEKQKYYKDLVIDDLIRDNYNKRIWGSEKQIHNEYQKIRYHRKN